MRAVLLVVVLGACRFNFGDHTDAGTNGDVLVDVQPPATFVPDWRSGTRIRAIVYRAVEGGDPHWFNWRDTLLDTDCYPAVTSDGVERCIPQFATSDTYYADAGCTVPLTFVRDNQCGRDIKYGASIVSGQYHIFPLGSVYSGSAYDVRVGCTLQTASGGTLYTTGTEEAPSMFEPVVYTNEAVGDYIRPYQGFGDGAALEIGSLSFNAGSCDEPAEALGPLHCRPSILRATPVYLDAGCTQRAYLTGDYTHFYVKDPTACNADFTFYQRTADLTAANYFVKSLAGCNSQVTPASMKLLDGLPTQNPFPSGTVVPGPDRGRLGTLYWVGPDGLGIVQDYSWDQQLHRRCRPFVGGDGKMRCLPTPSTTDNLYTSASCSGAPRSLAKECFPGVEPVDGPGYSSCEDSPWDVATLAKVTDTPAFDVEGTCSPLTTPVYDPTVRAVSLAPSTFAELTFTVE